MVNCCAWPNGQAFFFVAGDEKRKKMHAEKQMIRRKLTYFMIFFDGFLKFFGRFCVYMVERGKV